MSREKQAKPVKWSLSCRVVASLLSFGCDIQAIYKASSLTRAKALDYERSEIKTLLASDIVLANIQHNPQHPKTSESVGESVLARCGRSTGTSRM